MSVQAMFRCKKCGSLWPNNDLYKHATCCFDDFQMSPEDVKGCYEFSHYYQSKVLNKSNKDNFRKGGRH